MRPVQSSRNLYLHYNHYVLQKYKKREELARLASESGLPSAVNFSLNSVDNVDGTPYAQQELKPKTVSHRLSREFSN